MTEDRKWKIGCFSVALAVIILVVSVFCYFLNRPAPVYETNDVADYGIVKGNYDNDRPQEFISYFFPQKIEDYFSDITYHYKAKKLDTYAYEMYLEFVIQDAEKYTSFISNVIGNEVCEPFHFSPDYQAHYVSNYLTLSQLPEEHPLYIEGAPPSIGNAKIGLILFSDEQQRIVFVALGMFDGGGANVEELGYFFNRFGIDPLEYEKRASSEYVS